MKSEITWVEPSSPFTLRNEILYRGKTILLRKFGKYFYSFLFLLVLMMILGYRKFSLSEGPLETIGNILLALFFSAIIASLLIIFDQLQIRFIPPKIHINEYGIKYIFSSNSRYYKHSKFTHTKYCNFIYKGKSYRSIEIYQNNKLLDLFFIPNSISATDIKDVLDNYLKKFIAE